MNITIKNLLFILLGFTITVSQSFAQDTTKGHSDHKHKNQNTEQEEMGNQPMTMDCMSKTDSTKEMKMMKHNMQGMDHKMTMDCMSKTDSTKEMKMMKHNMQGMDHKMKMDCMSKPNSTKISSGMKHNMKNVERKMSSIVREGVIDLQAIDENKDGKVYQDTMDWNVISDEPGECPLCGMTLKKVSIKQAEENLIKNGFKIK